MTLFLDSVYFPNIQYVGYLYRFNEVYYEIYNHYQKRTWRNKMQLAGPNGPVILSVPLVKGKHQGQQMKDVLIDNNQPWQRTHWRTIQTLYGKSPYFIHYADIVENIFLQPYSHLAELNGDVLQCIHGILQWPAQLKPTTSYIQPGNPDIVDRRGAIPYPVSQKAHNSCPPYPQVFEDRQGFIANCSILDLIFCCGPEATLHMRGVNPELCS